MQLGTLLKTLENEGTAAEALEVVGDIVLFARVVEAADRFGETPGEYVAASVGRFAATAGDEAWLGLVAAMERADTPGAAALQRILDWAIREDAEPASEVTSSCSCGGTTCHGSA